ncbi:MAG: DUF3526 domain-containing protein [Gammaproteobacteria bacterium]|nr:DUF3526 domain-containing protein [Gammaproteobacteria bacterium]MBM4233404.1 DUF3526 domain-containing protein [Gammaproteobacteria bacterium]
MRSVDIFYSELTLLHREQIIPWVLVGLLVAMVFAGFSGRIIIKEKRAGALWASDEARVLIESLKQQAAAGSETARSPGAVAYSVLSMPVSKAATPLEGLAIGQADLLPDTYRLSARGVHTFLEQIDPENSLRLVSGNFDVAFLVVWVLPLLAIGFLFDVVVGERERGVLSLAMVAGASAGRFIWHKWWVRFLLLAAVTTVSIVIAAWIQEPAWTATTAYVLAGWILTSVIYLALWCALALVVSTGAGSSEAAATRLAGAWLVFVVLSPAVINLIAGNVMPSPSRVELTATLREATEQADKAVAAERDRWFFDHPDLQGDMDRRAYYLSVARSEAGIEKIMAPLLEEFVQNARDQQDVIELMKYLSPGTLTFRLLTSLSGSDGRQHANFRDAVVANHRDWRDFFVTRLETDAPLTAEDYDRLPTFVAPQIDGHQLILSSSVPLLLMLALTCLLCLLGSRKLRSTDLILGAYSPAGSR